MGVDTVGYTRALTRFFSLLQEGRLMRKTPNQFPVQIRSCKHAEPWLDSNLFVTLPRYLAETVGTFVLGFGGCWGSG
jgi:hypothetical protein